MAADLAIVICTLRRTRLLRRALASVLTLRRPDGFRLEVVVVDNSDAGAAADVISQMRAQALALAEPFEIRGVAAHPANISIARNAGVAATATPWVAFVDDDQTLDADWLIHVSEAIAGLPHDALFGAIEPEFEAPERATAAVRQLYSRRLQAPSGRDLVAFGPGKTAGFALSTANSIFRRATTLQGAAAPFDAGYGAGGGEDYDLIFRLGQAGRRFGWLPGARAREFVPASRCDGSYLRRRFYAGGQIFAAVVVAASARPRAAKWRLRIRAAFQAGWLLAQAPLLVGRGKAPWRDYSYRWAGVLGKLSIGELYPLYRKTETEG
jgi:succinoglycan biosynthesis protein ExoM